jgi:Fe-S cluster assembly protein SufD
VRQEENSRLTSRVFSFGGALGRGEVETSLEGRGAECVLEGLYLAKGRQQSDHRTFIDHAVPSCRSEELYKGVLGGEAVGIFDGRVLVRENAQRTDARQANKNLQLTRESRVYSKPQLQIYADDVKCAHGSATGQLDEEALFYLRSRGLGLEQARSVLVHAFAGEMVDRAGEGLREPLRRMVDEWMGITQRK